LSIRVGLRHLSRSGGVKPIVPPPPVSVYFSEDWQYGDPIGLELKFSEPWSYSEPPTLSIIFTEAWSS